MRRGLLVVLSVLVLAGCGASPEAAQPAQAPTPTPTPTLAPTGTPSPSCPPSGLLPREVFQDSAMGSRLNRLAVDNCGSTPVKLSGYPHPTLLDEDGEPLTIAVRHGFKGMGDQVPPEPTTFTLAPGESAQTSLTWRNTLVDYTKNVAGKEVLFAEAGVPLPLVVDTGDTGELFVSAWEPTKGP